MFDVDKLYLILPEFKVRKYDMFRAREDYAKENAVFKQVLSGFSHSQLAEDLLNADTDSFKEWFNENKDKYKLYQPRLSKVKYDFNKNLQDNSLEARNNMILDTIYSILTNSDTASKILNPGNFAPQKKTARIINILKYFDEKGIEKELRDVGIQLDKTIKKGLKTYPKFIVSYLFDLDLDTLDKIAAKTKLNIDPLSPRTQVILHQQNMTGAKMIGIYANHNANHALMQHTQLALSKENGSFILNGKEYTSLHGMMNADKQYISKNTAGFLAASVDNVKDPVLAALNQNILTADATMLLSRLGYNALEIGLLLAQPIIEDITHMYFREYKNGKDKNTIIDEVIDKYRKAAAVSQDLTYDNYKNNQFYIEDLAENILLSRDLPANINETDDFRKVEYYSKQLAVGYLFKRIMKSAEALGQLTQATKADTQNGAAGPTIADTELKIQKVTDLLEQVHNNNKFPLVGADVIKEGLSEITDEKELRKELLSSPLPYLQAFYTLGIEKTTELFKPYFPYYSKSFRDVKDTLRRMTKTGKLDAKTINNIYNDLLAYIMSKNDFFGSEKIINNEGDEITITSEDKRKSFINSFPEEFKRVVSKNKDIANLEFISRLKVIKTNRNSPVSTIVFKNVGRLSDTQREKYIRDWTSLLYMNNPEAQQLALNLFRYSYYRNGFAFGPNTFIHLAPTALRKVVPNYIDTLRSLLNSEDDYSQFIDQYIYNHLDNRKLVPEISDESSVSFTDDETNIKDEITFTIDDKSSYADKKIIRDRTEIGEETLYDFFDYIGKKIQGKYIYYKLSPGNTEQPNVATYKRIEPLGFRNNFIEYEYGKDAGDVNTVIDKNKMNYDPYNGTLARFEYKDYTGDISESDSTPKMSDEEREAYLQSSVEAFKQIYGVPLEDSAKAKNDNDMTSLSPNVDYKDANDEEVCGTNNI